MNKKVEANEGDAMLKVAEAFVGMGSQFINTDDNPLETVVVKINDATVFRGDANDPHAPDLLVRRL